MHLGELNPGAGFLVPALIFNLGLSLAITIPLVGVLVRYRANYSPKAIRLENVEDGSDTVTQVRTGPAVSGYFAMLKRIYKLEGWAGLYKGTMPVLLLSLFFYLLTGIYILVEGRPDAFPGKRPGLDTGPLAGLAYTAGSILVTLPVNILTYRAITTPYKLPFFGLRQSLRTLLTPTERARPYVLYLTPGLLVATILRSLISVLGVMPLLRLLLPELPKSKDEVDNMMIFKFSMYFIVVVVATVVLVPLDIMAARLALQRNHASAVPQEEGIALEAPPVYPGAAGEDVIGLRDEADPYLSFVDCAKRMVTEEGWGTMFRAWWITFFPLLAAGIVIAGQKQGLRFTGIPI
ncbi:mitochondrial carrier domain-containing protein [Lyophyllum atratum]|nr:mitochondrial carrier domain-containing protein [Lyophyllum atratum]